MKKMMFLSLALSVMAIGGAVANDSYSAEMGGPKKIKVNINVAPDCDCKPPINFNIAPCPPNKKCCHHNPAPHRFDHNKHPKHNHKAHCPGDPGFGKDKPNGPKPHGGDPGMRPNTPPPGRPGGR